MLRDGVGVGERERCVICRLQKRALGLGEKECIIWVQSRKAAWVRRHRNWAEREQNLDRLSRENGTSKSTETEGSMRWEVTSDWEDVRGDEVVGAGAGRTE